MTEIDPKNSVQKEQFGDAENTEKVEKIENAPEAHSEAPQETGEDKVTETADQLKEKEVPKEEGTFVSDKNTTHEAQEKKEENTPTEAETSSITAEETEKSEVSETSPVDAKNETAHTSSEKKEDVQGEETTGSAEEGTPELSKDDAPLVTAPQELSQVDYSKFDKEKLVDIFSQYLSDFHVEKIKDHIEAIKSVFYKKLHQENEEIKEKFIAEGGQLEDFKIEESPIELKLKDLLNVYREKRNEFNKDIESQKEKNLQKKYEIIEAIKELINSQESLNKTFQDFRNLQEEWRDVGPVPQNTVKDLWESYHYHVEAFYDYIKINKELRDLDFKKNLDSKLALCEKAEELLLEPSVVEAFRRLQVLHDQWREIGPVPADKRAEIWERFREATSKINHRHQEYFVNLKEEQKKNLQEKTVLCEKAEEIANLNLSSTKEWEEKSKEIIELQKVWKTIGFAPKKHNTKIYERFRAACDKFFDQKRDYFAQNREEQENNLQLKTELCIQAEGLQDSTDWKKTTDELIKLQKRWKTIGPVPIKQSDKIWKRFRAACDKFFNSKAKYYENIDSKYEDNLKLKEKLINDIVSFELKDDVSENLKELKEFQRKWSEIGFVPLKQKDSIQEKYRETINKKFDQLKLDEDKKSILKFRGRIESIASKPNADRRLAMERDKCFNKLKQLEGDITLWENNIGFFSNSKNAESMITDVEKKITNARRKIESLQEKINIIDEFD